MDAVTSRPAGRPVLLLLSFVLSLLAAVILLVIPTAAARRRGTLPRGSRRAPSARPRHGAERPATTEPGTPSL